MGKLIDLTGQQFGKLTVIKRAQENDNSGHLMWECQCECGKTVVVRSNSLRYGKTKSCGCLRSTRRKLIDLTGQTFGRLQVIKQAENIQIPSGRSYVAWECQCECGNKVVVRGADLRNGNTKSCGCLKRANLIGQKFGRLTVIGRAENTKSGNTRWNCKCDCGNIATVAGYCLWTGNTKSCGCLKSIGEANIEKLLLENNISYKREYTFEDLKDKQRLRFDFAIFDNDNNLQYLIEFDGIQHFETGSGWNDLANYEKVKLHDQMKNNYCKEHNIPLIRIPYTQQDIITIKDLVLETSNFLVY